MILWYDVMFFIVKVYKINVKKKSWCKGIFYLDLNKFGKLINRIFKKILYKLNIYFNLL